MTKYKNILMALVALSLATNVMAQDTIEVEPLSDEEISAAVDDVSTSDIVVLKKRKRRVQVQPRTIVEASPLEQSQAERIRSARQQAEIATEQKIVEKLEESRLEDEQKRAQRLFGDRFDSMSSAQQQSNVVNQQQSVVPAVQQPQTVVIPVQQVETPSNKKDEYDVEEMKTDIIESVKSDLRDQKELAEAERKQAVKSYISGYLGTADYPDAYNVANDLATGVAVGTQLSDRLTVEGAFIYSNYFIERNYWLYKELDQYNFAVAAKYSVLPGRFKPYVGGVASYTYRKYADVNAYGYTYTNSDNATSHSFDVGMALGVDVELSDGFVLGFDYRYMMNVTNRDDFSSPYRHFRNNYRNSEFIEEIDYSMMNLALRLAF